MTLANPYLPVWGFEQAMNQGTIMLSSFRHMTLRIPDPRKFIHLANVMATTDDVDRRWRRRERNLTSLKSKASAQRKFDRASRVRTVKRRAELAMRKSIG